MANVKKSIKLATLFDTAIKTSAIAACKVNKFTHWYYNLTKVMRDMNDGFSNNIKFYIFKNVQLAVKRRAGEGMLLSTVT